MHQLCVYSSSAPSELSAPHCSSTALPRHLAAGYPCSRLLSCSLQPSPCASPSHSPACSPAAACSPSHSPQLITQLHWAPQMPTALHCLGAGSRGSFTLQTPQQGHATRGRELPHKSTAPPCVRAAASGEEASFWVPEGERFCMPFRGLGRRSSDKSEIHL